MLQHIPDNDWEDPDTSNNDTGILLIESPTWMRRIDTAASSKLRFQVDRLRI